LAFVEVWNIGSVHLLLSLSLAASQTEGRAQCVCVCVCVCVFIRKRYCQRFIATRLLLHIRPMWTYDNPV
jgi:hypothetical protein